MFLAKVLHESSNSFFGPYLISGGSREPVWGRIGSSVVENSHGGVSKHDSGVPIDTVAVPNWCFLLRCCMNRVAASLDLTCYPRDRGNQCGTGLGRQWMRIHMEEFPNRTVGYQLHRGRSELVFPAKELHESSGSFFVPYLLSGGSTEPVWCRIGASVVENSHGVVSKQHSGVPIDTVAVPN